MIAKTIEQRSTRGITILPVPMRIDHAQTEKVEAGLAVATGLFEGLLEGMSDEQRREYWAEVEVPYRPSYAYEETLATFADRPGSRTSLLASYERIVARITGGEVATLPSREEWLRLRTRLLFSRTQSANMQEVVLDFLPEDQLWAEWIAAILADAEITVRWIHELPAAPGDSEVPVQTLTVVSDSYLARLSGAPPGPRPDQLMISVTETRLPHDLEETATIFLAGQPEQEAIGRLVDRLNGRRPADAEVGLATLRYPGGDRPQVQNIPARNANFTGRDEDLRELRKELRERRPGVMLPLTVQGLGGVGKTQVALEYAHRFRADYDIIWWMNCGQAQYVDASLADLGQQLREVFGAAVPEEGGVTEVVEQVLQTLSDGLPDKRWLLVYDNAEDVTELSRLLPAAGGHVLITSGDKRWKDKGTALELARFKQEESVSHLRRRLRDITDRDAEELAAVLDNMPLAVAAAGALMATTNISVGEYLRLLKDQPERTFADDHPLAAYPRAVAKAWNLSLDHLREKVPAAARLLGICSVMAPDISLDLVHSQAMADSLRDLDPTISEQAMIGRLTRQIDLLALIKLDNNNRQIQVHRVVQAVVTDRMSDEEKISARGAVHRMVVDAQPEGDVDDPQTWRRYRVIWPHLTPSRAMWSTDTRVRSLLIERVRYLRQRDDLERGQRRGVEIERAWMAMLSGTPDPKIPESAEMVTGKPDPRTAESLPRQLLRLQFHLANILRDLAQFQPAKELDEAVLAGQLERLGPEHVHTLATRSSLAGDLRALGDYDAALDLDKKTYESWTNVFGDETRGTLAAAHNLALSYLLTGDFQRALTLDRLTLQRRTSLLGATNPRTLNSGSSVARDLLEAGRYAEAAGRMEILWEQCRDTLGDNDRITLNARLLLGVALRCAGHPDLAADHIDWAKNGLTRGFGPDSTDALACRLSQALNGLAMKQRLVARTAAEEVLLVYEQRLGPDHPHSLICKLDISTALCLDEDYPAAEVEARSAVDGLEHRLGADHPYTLAANIVLASILANQGQLAEAREMEQRVTVTREKVLGPDHPDTLRGHANLLLTQHDLGVEGAAKKRQKIIGDLSALIGSDHPDVTTALASNRLLGLIDPQPY